MTCTNTMVCTYLAGAARLGRTLSEQVSLFRAKKLPASPDRERHVNNQRTTNQSHNNHINACYVNARSIRNKFTDLEELAATENFHIIAVTE